MIDVCHLTTGGWMDGWMGHYLKCGDMHDPGEGRFKHHGDARADGHYDHHPVQVGDEAQKIAAGTWTHAVNKLVL